MKKTILLLIFTLLLSIMSFTLVSCGSDPYDEAMGSYDWGDDYYYNSNTNQVEKSLSGILGD